VAIKRGIELELKAGAKERQDRSDTKNEQGRFASCAESAQLVATPKSRTSTEARDQMASFVGTGHKKAPGGGRGLKC